LAEAPGALDGVIVVEIGGCLGAPYAARCVAWISLDRAAPCLGEHNAEVFRGLLGLQGEENEDLARDSLIR
jgi:crotonobetainyl-CoA:carnitine CoA-transferase CaiB-like acyl-CoA transferase